MMLFVIKFLLVSIEIPKSAVSFIDFNLQFNYQFLPRGLNVYQNYYACQFFYSVIPQFHTKSF